MEMLSASHLQCSAVLLAEDVFKDFGQVLEFLFAFEYWLILLVIKFSV